MKYSVAVVLASVAAGVQAQGVSSAISPAGAAPSGCVATGSGTYEITVVKPTVQKRSLVERADCGGEGTLVVQLNNGILTDSKGRIGAIVANRQFQFDGPPAQTGSIYTAGWSICSNNSLAIGPTTDFYQCLSGGFYNLYDQTVGAQCQAVNLNVIACGASTASTTGSAAGVSTQSDGQPTASSAVSAVSQQTDGQPTAASATTAPVSQISDGQVQATSAVPISQISDGQIQATTPAVVSQISDGQPQATAATNGTITTGSPAPIATGGASSLVASGAAVILGAAAMLFL